LAAVDFITALGRLLHDGSLRDAFAADPAAAIRQIGVQEQDRATMLQLSPRDLEFQARVLLRKRFVLVEKLLPATCGSLDGAAWPEFAKCSRSSRAGEGDPVVADAADFIRHLRRALPQVIDPMEAHRCEFAGRKHRLSLRLVLRAGLPLLHLLVRRGPDRWSEWQLHFGR
jgi:hypothetical protein